MKCDLSDSKSCGPFGHEGSTPSFGTSKINHLQEFNFSNTLKKSMALPVSFARSTDYDEQN